MRLFEEFKLYENMWDSLTEAKADTQRLIDFAGEELANRFLAIKSRLKSPENDLYYWIKNKTIDELEQAVYNIENTKSNRALAREAKVNGAELVCDTEHWKVYHITTFEASQTIGRDTKWCITGIHGSDYYWNDYTRRGVDFYFLVTKGEYDPRGLDSKIAIAVFPSNLLQVFNQQDEVIDLNDVPYIDEVNIPGIDIKSMEQGDDTGIIFCSYCDSEINEDDAWIDPYGNTLCYDCWSYDFFSCYMCNETFEWSEAVDAEDVTIDYPVCTECAAKHHLYTTDAASRGPVSSYEIYIASTDKKATTEGVPNEEALSDIIKFIRCCRSKTELQNLVLTWNEGNKLGGLGSDMIAWIEEPDNRVKPEASVLDNLVVGRPDIEDGRIRSAIMTTNMIAR